MHKDFKTSRIVMTYKMEVAASPQKVFPLLCPEKEKDWIDGWESISSIVYSESGFAEDACVFESNHPSEGKAVWICSRYEPERQLIEFIKHVVDKAIIKWTFDVTNNTENASTVKITYIMTGLTEAGNGFVKAFSDTGFPALMHRLEESLKYYLATGKMKK